jgi:hypothetical protein
VAIPLLVATHREHARVVQWWDGREVALAGHAAIETYSVLTRLPGDLRVEPQDAARLLAERFSPPLLPAQKTVRRLVDTLARAEISGGAVYDALVALAAVEHDAELGTRDARARATYESVGARVLIAA